MQVAISARDVALKYGKTEALKGCSLDISENEIFGLLGPNGAGKSTFLKIASGQLKPDSGTVTMWGRQPGNSELKRIIGIVPQDYSFGFDFTVEDNLRLLAKLYDFKGAEVQEVVERKLETYLLKDNRGKLAGSLSGGYKRLLNIALSTIHSPSIMLLDEPTVGLDPDIRASIWRIIKDFKEKSGNTVVLTTHYLEEATYLCDRLAIISEGSIKVVGTPQELVHQYGGETEILLQLSGQTEPLMKAVKGINGVVTCSSKGELLSAVCTNDSVTKVISALDRMVEEKGMHVKNTMVKEPDLNDVFKSVVGSEIGVR